MRLKEAAPIDVAPLRDGDVSGAIDLLRSASLRELRNEEFLREELLLHLGLNGEILKEFPETLYPWCGKGIRSWQYPIQFSKYLAYLSDRDVRSYVEIGCRFGGTFIIVVEFLRRFSDLHRACAMDITSTGIMKDYARVTSGVEYRIANSLEPEARSFLGSTQWDLAFVDGDHRYEGCWADFLSVRQRSKMIALHDIVSDACPGVQQVWGDIKKIVPSNRLFEATDQYREVKARTGSSYLGIGVVDFS